MVYFFDELTSHASWTRLMGDGVWPKMGFSNHDGTVDWMGRMLAHWSLADAYVRVVT